MTGRRFTVDLDDLELTVQRMAQAGARIESGVAELEGRLAKVHGAWHGPAADAHRAAHEEWSRGLAVMRAALDDFHARARTAHANYAEAAATNVRMWAQVR